MGKCEHGLTSKECLVCASPKHGAAEPVQEPVAWRFQSAVGGWAYGSQPPLGRKYPAYPLYTAPPERLPLTEEEIDVTTAQERDALLDHIYEYGTAAEGVLERIRKLCRAVEKAVWEKNHG